MPTRHQTPPAQGISRNVFIVAMIISLLIGAFLGYTAATVIIADRMASVPQGAAPSQAAAPQGQPPATRGQDLHQMAEDNPDDPRVWFKLGHHYFDSGQPTLAIEAYERGLTLDPDQPDVITDLGVMYRRAGDPEQAIIAFDRAIALEPGHEIARFNKGIVLMHDLDDPQAAAEVWRELLRINPDAVAPNGKPLAELIQDIE